MDTRFSQEQQVLRQELRDYFTSLMSPEKIEACMGKEGRPIFHDLVEQLGKDGIPTLGWPV